jgi:hypothetical protein
LVKMVTISLAMEMLYIELRCSTRLEDEEGILPRLRNHTRIEGIKGVAYHRDGLVLTVDKYHF